MAKKAIAVVLIAAMLTLSACSAIKVNENDSTEAAVKENISFTVGKEESENVVTSEPTGELTVQTSKSETTTADLKTSDNVTTTKPTTTTKKNSETKITTTKTTQKVETTKTKPTTAQTKAPTTTVKPTAVKTTAVKTTVATTQTPTTAKPFDINYWINFTKSYAQSIGLSLDSGATGCWDNPIDADARCIYLERDITSRLTRYMKDKEITAIWVWSEYLGNGEYLLYIGYA